MKKRQTSQTRAPFGIALRHRQRVLRRVGQAARHGFTIIELLVATAIIILLLSLVVVAVKAATKTAQNARTVALMNSIKNGLIRFKEDIGYFPPVLGSYLPPSAALVNDQRNLFVLLPSQIIYVSVVQNWYSSTTIADYLLGYGNHRQDGFGRVAGAAANQDWDQETALGIRPPGPDGYWGGSISPGLGRLSDRMQFGGTETLPKPIDIGKVYGPYLELKDEKLLGAIDGTPDAYGNLRVLFPGESGYNPNNPQVVVDYWGKPIRYYRRPYPPGALGQSYRTGVYDFNNNGNLNDDPLPTLSDWVFLRPFSVKSGAERNARFADSSGDLTTTAELETGEFAIFSNGPDGALNHNLRVDPPNSPNNAEGTNFANRDNIVEVGP